MTEILRAIATGSDVVAEPFRRLDERDIGMTATGEEELFHFFGMKNITVSVTPSV
jgi:hypothetical protein